MADHDQIALDAAEEIALMWGQDRSQFVAKIQVRVRAALDQAVSAGEALPGPGNSTVIGIDHAHGDDETTVIEDHFVGSVLHVDEINTDDVAKAVAVYWEAYERQQAGSSRRAGACAAGVSAVLRYARTGPLTLLNLSNADARDSTRYRWWRDNLQLLVNDEAGLHGVAFSFQVPWATIERATSGEVADAIADAALSAQPGEKP